MLIGASYPFSNELCWQYLDIYNISVGYQIVQLSIKADKETYLKFEKGFRWKNST